MIRALLLGHRDALLVLAGMLLRDAWVWCAAKVSCWRHRRKASRQREETIRAEAARISAAMAEQKASLPHIAPVRPSAPAPPFPELISGPFMIAPSTDSEVFVVCRQLIANFAAQRKPVTLGNGEDN